MAQGAEATVGVPVLQYNLRVVADDEGERVPLNPMLLSKNPQAEEEEVHSKVIVIVKTDNGKLKRIHVNKLWTIKSP